MSWLTSSSSGIKVGSPTPSTFVGFEQYVSHPNNYTTFTMQVAMFAAA